MMVSAESADSAEGDAPPTTTSNTSQEEETAAAIATDNATSSMDASASERLFDDSEQNGDDDIALTMVAADQTLAYEELEHSLHPGDHVIRWEMLPIAWPIQIHGIVLQVGKGYVTLADFGLTAQAGRNNQDEEDVAAAVEKEGDKTTAEHAPFSAVTQKMEQAVAGAWEKMRKDKKEKKKKQRITVHVVTTQKDLNRWHKVNYGGKLFGLGGEEPEDGEGHKKHGWFSKFHRKPKEQSDSEGVGEPADHSPSKVKVAAAKVGKSALETTKSSFARMSARFHHPPADGSNNNTDQITESPKAPSPTSKVRGSFAKMSAVFHPHASTSSTGTANEEKQQHQNGTDTGASPTKAQAAAAKVNNFQKTALESTKNSFARMSARFHPNGSTTTSETSPKSADRKGDGSPKAKPIMNDAMKKLMAEKEGTSDDGLEQQNENKRVLPKSDPPKVVLARTYFLLSHGESVLPPYHIFHSNSECMAVFCKTGVWSTLQAAVFLHSTGIANAKTTFLTLGGMAAAAPMLAPAIAVGGLAFVGAPYWILRESKGKWEEATRKLTDLFWAQAEPEVFVECIEHWSGLVEKPKEEGKSDENDETENEKEELEEIQEEEHKAETEAEEEKKQDEEKKNPKEEADDAKDANEADQQEQAKQEE